MKRRLFLSLGLAAVFSGRAAFARSFAESVVAQLKKQGYRHVRVERTLLGRTRILAERNGGQREIILNPRTGEILRDLWITVSGTNSADDHGLIDTRTNNNDGEDNDDEDDADKDKSDDEDGGDRTRD